MWRCFIVIVDVCEEVWHLKASALFSIGHSNCLPPFVSPARVSVCVIVWNMLRRRYYWSSTIIWFIWVKYSCFSALDSLQWLVSSTEQVMEHVMTYSKVPNGDHGRDDPVRDIRKQLLTLMAQLLSSISVQMFPIRLSGKLVRHCCKSLYHFCFLQST